MTKQIFTVSTLLVAALALGTTGCKKKEAQKQETPPAQGEKKDQAGHQADAHPAAKADAPAPKVALTGSPAEQLTQVLEITVDKLSKAKGAPEVVTALQSVMKDYDITKIRDEAAKAKAAGQGASEAVKTKFGQAKDKYKEVIGKLGSQNPAIIGPVAGEFAKLFGIS